MQKLIMISVFWIAAFSANAQTAAPQLVSSAGESFTNTVYNLDWSIGELVTETFTGSQNTLTQGFHQGTYTISSIEGNLVNEFKIIAFPNPTTDLISIKIESSITENLRFAVMDLTGKVLQTGEVINNNQQINFSNYSFGTYLVTISMNNKNVKTFQIIKN
jgi:hypothetical protein